MSTAVLEIKEKIERLNPGEFSELKELIEDMEDRALAEKAKAEGDFVTWDDYRSMQE